jgi:hypothetical protein
LPAAGPLYTVILTHPLLKDSSVKKQFIKEKINYSFGDRINNMQALNIFSSHADVPPSLIGYLELVTSELTIQ